MNVKALLACADWNAEKGTALFRQHHYEKNHDRSQAMLRIYKRHMHNCDQLRQAAFLLERTR